MKHFALILLVLLNHADTALAQIDAAKLKKLNLADSTDLIIFKENKSLNTSMIETDVWVSDYYDNQYDTDFGIIINKVKLLQSLPKDNSVNKRLLIRLILAHEKMHAKHLSKFKNWKTTYSKVVPKEYLLIDEAQADMAAGYNAFEFKDREDAKYTIKLIQQMGKNDIETQFNLSLGDLNFITKLRKDEANALNLFASLGDNQGHMSKYPNSYQRSLAFELGLHAYNLISLSNEIENQKKTLKDSTLTALNIMIDAYRNTLDYRAIITKDNNYFYESWSRLMVWHIIHSSKNVNKYITFKFTGGRAANDSSDYAEFELNISNKNKVDSLIVAYAILLKCNPDTSTYKNDVIAIGVQNRIVLAPNETKVVTSSMFDISESLKGLRPKVVFPGQHGSLYSVELTNPQRRKFYKAADRIDEVNYKKKASTIENLLENLAVLQNDFSISDIDDYITGAGFIDIHSDETVYSTFLLNRPFELVVPSNSAKYFLRASVFQNENIRAVEQYLKNIKAYLEKTGSFKLLFRKGGEEYDDALEVANTKGVNICKFSIFFDEINNDYQIELKIFKTN